MLYAVSPCICRCARKLGRGIDHDRATAAPPVKVPRLTWDWPPEAQVRALLWLAGRDPLPETLSKVAGAYADLPATLSEKHGAPLGLTEKAVYNELRKLFAAYGTGRKYIPNMKEVLRVLAAVGETLPDAISAAGSSSAEAGGTSPEATAPSSAPVPSGRGAHLRTSASAATAKAVATEAVAKILKGAVGQIGRMKVTVEAVRVPPAAAVGAADPGPASTTATADFDFGDAALSDAAFEVLALVMEYLHDTMATREAEQYKLPSPIPVTEQDLLEYCQTRLEKSKFASLLLMLARGKDPAQVQSGSQRTAERFNKLATWLARWLMAGCWLYKRTCSYVASSDGCLRRPGMSCSYCLSQPSRQPAASYRSAYIVNARGPSMESEMPITR